MITQLKERLQVCETYNERRFVLSVLPKHWSVQKISSEMNVSRHLAETTKKLVEEKGILCMPGPRGGRKLDDSISQLVVDFYLNDEISRMMPGLRDYKVCTSDGEKKSVHILQHNII